MLPWDSVSTGMRVVTDHTQEYRRKIAAYCEELLKLDKVSAVHFTTCQPENEHVLNYRPLAIVEETTFIEYGRQLISPIRTGHRTWNQPRTIGPHVLGTTPFDLNRNTTHRHGLEMRFTPNLVLAPQKWHKDIDRMTALRRLTVGGSTSPLFPEHEWRHMADTFEVFDPERRDFVFSE